MMSTIALLCCVYFVYDTFPRSYSIGASEVYYDLLPPGRWGIGPSFCNDLIHPQSGYTYGIIKVRRDFDLTK
jgi:hypothetical protein